MLPHVCGSDPSPTHPASRALDFLPCPWQAFICCVQQSVSKVSQYTPSRWTQLTFLNSQQFSGYLTILRLITNLNSHRRFLVFGHKVHLRALLPAGHKQRPSLAMLSGSRWLHGTQSNKKPLPFPDTWPHHRKSFPKSPHAN